MTRPTTSIARMMSFPSSAAVFFCTFSTGVCARTCRNVASIAATLSEQPGMRGERRVNGGVARCRPRDRLERPRILAQSERVTGRLDITCSAQRRGPGPGGTIAVALLGASLGAQRDQLGEVGDGRDVSGLGDTNEAVCVQVVAEQEPRVAVGGGEQARVAVVDEV